MVQKKVAFLFDKDNKFLTTISVSQLYTRVYAWNWDDDVLGYRVEKDAKTRTFSLVFSTDDLSCGIYKEM